MLSEYYEQIETFVMYLSLSGLFVLMGFAVHDVLKKNDIPTAGRVVVYGVLFFGCVGFLAKGIIQVFFDI